MKPRLPNSREKEFLRQLGLNPKYFLTVGKDFESYTFVETQTGKQITERR